MNIAELIDHELWAQDRCVIIDQFYRVKRPAEAPEIKAHNESLNRIAEVVEKRIAELEAKLPKVVKPRELPESVDNGPGVYMCSCKKLVCRFYIFCHHCGAKLDWSRA